MNETPAERLARLLVRCQQCGFDNWPGMAYCGRCGTHLSVECASCGFANPPDHRFCGHCGQPLIVEGVAWERARVVPSSESRPGEQRPTDDLRQVGELRQATEPRPAGELRPVGESRLVSEPRPTGEPRLAGERRSVTVLIADVKGSTQILEQIGTEAWVEVMNRVLHVLEAEVYRYGGQVDQFRGDGLVAFFGVSTAHEDDPERAVLAALAMQESVKGLAQELHEQQSIDLRVRIGLNTGQVIVTSIGGSDQHSEDTAMGEAIALAARIESAAEPGTVLVSENTYHIVAAHFRWQPLGEITVKGLSKPVAIYRPLSPVFDFEPMRANVYGLQSALVGRDREVETFRQLVMGLAGQRGGILAITGEKGMGKSFLVAYVRQQFVGQDALMAQVPWPTGDASAGSMLTWIQVRCRSYEQSRPYSMWINMLRRWLEMSEDEPLTEARERLRERCVVLWPQHWGEYYPYLAALLSMPPDDEFSPDLLAGHAEGLRQQLFFVLRSWVQELARHGPLVLALSDMHWIDATSLDVLRYCLPLCEHEALLWVLVFRPERNSIIWPFRYHLETEYPHRLTTIHLSVLDEQGSRALIEQLIGPDVLPAETRDLIVRTAEGNPYYIREFVYSLIRQGVLVQDAISGHWYATRAVNSLKLPDTLQSLLLARIDALSVEERRVLQVAAVIGSVFWENVLAGLLDNIARADLRVCLTALERAQLIYEGSLVPVMGKEYIFKSTLICDAAYEGLLQSERVVYHRRIADYLAQFVNSRHAASVDKAVGDASSYDNLISFSLVAYHYHLAQAFDKELWYARAAAAQAQRVYANAEALDLNRRVLELLDQMEAAGVAFVSLYPEEQGSWVEWRLDALVRLGQVCFGMGQLDQAEQSFRQAIELGQACLLPMNRLVRLYYWLAESLYWQDRYDEQIAVAERGLALIGEAESAFELALMNLELAGAYNMKGDVEQFCMFTSRTAELIRRLPYAEELRPAYCHVAIMKAYRHKEVTEAMDWLTLLEQGATQHHDLRALGEAYLVRGEILARQGNLEQAVQMERQAFELFEQIQDVKHQSWCLSTLSRTYLVAGDLVKAQEYALYSLELAQQTGSRRFIKSAYWSLSSIYICRNDQAQAFEALQKVVEFSRETGDMQGVWWANRALGRLYLERGETQRAAECLHDALAVLDRELPALTDLAALSRELEGIYDHQDVLQLFYRFVRQSGLAGALGTYQPFEPAHILVAPEPSRLIARLPHDLAEGWNWVDPLDDCTLTAGEGVEIRAANGRDLWHINLSAPRLLHTLSGNWAMQCRCVAVSDDLPAIGGLLVWKDERNFVRLDWGVRGASYLLLLGCVDGQDVILGHTQLPTPLAKEVWLRVEAVGRQINLWCSIDGNGWSRVGTVKRVAGRTVQVGPYAVGLIDRSVYHGEYVHGAAMRFEAFELWHA